MAHFLRTILRSGAVVLGTLLWGLQSAWAINATQLIGVGAVHRALGGAGVAQPMDGAATYLNPAGIQRLGPRLDLGFTLGFVKTGMDTTAAPAGNPGSANAESDNDGALLPSSSLILPVGRRAAVGIGAFVTNGFGVDFPVSRLAAGGNAFDTGGRYGLVRLIPAFSYQLLDKLWLGAGVNIGIAMFNSDSATAAFTQTTGRNRFDQALGIGGNFGLIYEPITWLSLGATYNSRVYFARFRRYQDLLGASLDLPQQIAAGVSIRPLASDELTFLSDFRWVNYSGVGILGNAPTAGGLGWRDQYIVNAGIEYDLRSRLHFPLELRAGYNYGRNVVPPGAVTHNILIGNGIQHHLSGGFTVHPRENTELSFAYTRNLSASLTDDGSSIPAFAGGKVSGSSHFAAMQFTLRFGGPPPGASSGAPSGPSGI